MGEKINTLIRGHQKYLSVLKENKFTIHRNQDNYIELPLSFLINFIEKAKDNRDFKLSELTHTNPFLKDTILQFVRENKQLDNPRAIGIAFPCLKLREDEKKYVALAIYQLDIDEDNDTIRFEKIETNKELLSQLKNYKPSIDKNDHLSKFDLAMETISNAHSLFEFISKLISMSIDFTTSLSTPFVLYGSIKCLKKISSLLRSPKSDTEAFDESMEKDEEVAILLSYDKQNYTENLIDDYKDILKYIPKFQNKLTKLFDKISPPDSELLEREYQLRTWVKLDGGSDLSDSQRKNYGRILLQKITAIQGPPGTGKTRLITQFCLDRLFETLLSAFKGDGNSHTVLIASTNNKAIENVLEKLELFDREYTEKNLLTGKYLKGYLRLGSRDLNKYIFEKEIKEALFNPTNEINEQEVLKNKELLREEITPLLDFLENFRKKQESLFHLEERLNKLRLSIDRLHGELREEEKIYEEFANKLFTTKTAASNFNRENLTTLNQLMSKFKKWFYILFFSHCLKQKLKSFIIEKSIKLSGEGDFKYLSLKEIYLRNIDFISDIEEFLNRKERLEHLRLELSKLSNHENKMLEDKNNLSSTLAKEREIFDDKILKLFIRLREYQFWNLMLDKEISGKFRDFPSNWWDIFKSILKFSPIVICTALSVRNVFPLFTKDAPENAQEIFDTVIIDEAGQTLLTYSIPLYLRGKHFVSVGDSAQLSPIVNKIEDKEIEKLFENLPPYLSYRCSTMETFEEIDETNPDERRLREHFRCRERIIKFCDELMNYKLIVNTKDEPYQPKLPFPEELRKIFNKPLTFINVRGKTIRIKKSRKNEEEAHFIAEFLTSLAKYTNPEDLAVITPYREQVSLIERILSDKLKGIKFAIGTVHRLQGDERDIVLISSVDSKEEYFKNSPLWAKRELLNVAISRAKKNLFLIGNSEVIEALGENYLIYKLYTYIKENGVMIDEDEILRELN